MEYELYHHGILGMKWGIRRYQNPDGSLTPAGRRRIAKNAQKVSEAKRAYERAGFFERKKAREKYDKARDRYDKFMSKIDNKKETDDQLLNGSKLTSLASKPVSQIATSQNVNAGKKSLEEKVRLFSLIVSATSSVVDLTGKIRSNYSDAKRAVQDRELNQKKHELEVRKQDLEWRKQDLEWARYNDKKAADERKAADEKKKSEKGK